MAANILSIGQSGLMAAQAGLNTTSHNIANSATPGYSRQLVIQGTAGGQDFGFGFIGKGTGVDDVRRVYSQYLGNQVVAAQTSKNQLETYFTEISRINNQFADSSAGLSPAMQDFFKGVQDLASDPNSTAARQSTLSNAQALVARFQSLDEQLSEMRQGVNNQLTSLIGDVNVYATQIADLNQSIERAQGTDGHPPNDLLDQRDQVIADLSKDVQVSVVKQGNSYNVFIGTGQPLVVGTQTFKLVATPSPTDLSRIEAGYTSNGTVSLLAENALSGGKLGGLFDFRSKTLDVAQNSIGRIAIGLATTFNTQHKLGQDQNGALGGNFFNVGTPSVTPSTANNSGSAAVLSARVTNVNALTTSDYRLQFVGGNYALTRVSDNAVLANTTFAAAQTAASAEGFTFSLSSGAFTAGDEFLIKPTANGATGFGVAIADTTKIAAAAPLRTVTPAANTGSGDVSAGVVSSTSLIPARTLTYAGGNLTGFPPTLPVTVTSGGVTTTYAAGAPVPYLAGDIVSFDGIELSGIPAVAGAYTVGPPNATLTFNSLPTVTPAGANTGNLVLASSVANAGALVNSDYRIDFAGGNYSITRLSDNVVVYPANPVFPPAAAIDGLNFSITSGAPAAGDSFRVQRNTLTGFPPYLDVTVTPSGGAATTYPAGTPVSYTAGATISYGGMSFVITGSPANADTFIVTSNTGAVGDNRNALLLGALQNGKTLVNGSASFQGAYSQLVNLVGNKTRELEVTSAAQDKLLTQAVEAQQSESGVNLDEEATNMMRYQQAYQAAGKIMQTANVLFDVILSLNNH